MDMQGIEMIEDWKVVFKALDINTSRYDGSIMMDMADGTLMIEP